MDYSTLPSDISLDHAMTAENLCVAWYARTEELTLIGVKDPVFTEWVLAGPENAWEQAAIKNSNKNLVALISLSDLRGVCEQLNSTPAWWPFSKVYALKTPEGLKWTTHAKDGDVALEGNPKDLFKLCTAGEDILLHQKYKQVFFDYRPTCEGHPQDWINFMRDPSNAAACRVIIRESRLKRGLPTNEPSNIS